MLKSSRIRKVPMRIECARPTNIMSDATTPSVVDMGVDFSLLLSPKIVNCSVGSGIAFDSSDASPLLVHSARQISDQCC
jgi:hypothetical protein